MAADEALLRGRVTPPFGPLLAVDSTTTRRATLRASWAMRRSSSRNPASRVYSLMIFFRTGRPMLMSRAVSPDSVICRGTRKRSEIASFSSSL